MFSEARMSLILESKRPVWTSTATGHGWQWNSRTHSSLAAFPATNHLSRSRAPLPSQLQALCPPLGWGKVFSSGLKAEAWVFLGRPLGPPIQSTLPTTAVSSLYQCVLQMFFRRPGHPHQAEKGLSMFSSCPFQNAGRLSSPSCDWLAQRSGNPPSFQLLPEQLKGPCSPQNSPGP